MLRVARLCDAKWHMPGHDRAEEGKPRAMALGDAMQIASALWVKEAIGVPDLEFLTFDNWCAPDGATGNRLCLLHLQDYAVDVGSNADVKAAIRLTRLEPVVHARPSPIPVPWASARSTRRARRVASVLSEPREFRVYERREDGPHSEDRSLAAVMAVVDGQQVFGQVLADQPPAALGAAELRRLRDIVNALAPVFGGERAVGLERVGRTPTGENSGAAPRSRTSRPTRMGRTGAHVGTCPATMIDRTPSACRRRAPATSASRKPG